MTQIDCWIPIADAYRNLLESASPDVDGSTAMRVVRTTLDSLLQQGSVQAKAAIIDVSAHLLSGETLVIEQGRDIEIPPVFWFHFFHADERISASVRLATLDDAHCYAARRGSDWSFRTTDGLLDGVTSVTGNAHGILVNRDQIPGLPKQRGRKPGPSKLFEADAHILEMALNDLASGESQGEIVSRLAPMLSGPSSDDSKKRRLREWIKNAQRGD